MTIRLEVANLLEEFQKCIGRGNLISANVVLVKVINLLVDHIEKVQPNLSVTNYTCDPRYTAAQAAVPGPNYQILETGRLPVSSFGVIWPPIAAPVFTTAPVLSENDKKKEALEKLHEANYILDPDYTAIKEHLNLSDEEKAEREKNSGPDIKAMKVRRKPGPKPKARIPEGPKVRRKPGPKPKAKIVG